MKRGFTLIELLASIVIVGIIGSITFVVIDKTLKASKQKLYDIQLQNIYDGAHSWVVDNMDIMNNKTYYCITISELQKESYLQPEIKNPITDELFDINSYIKITTTNAGYNYSLDENNECIN